MFRLRLDSRARSLLLNLMSVPGADTISVVIDKGNASFSVIKDDMFKLFTINVADTAITANYLVTTEVMRFMLQSPELLFEEEGDKLCIKSCSAKPDFRQVIVPLRHDYSFGLINNCVALIQNKQYTEIENLGVIRQLTILCKFQKTGIVIKDGWGLIDTPMFKACRPTQYPGDLVITEHALMQFASFIREESRIAVGRVNNYTVCINTSGVMFGFKRVRNVLPSFVESYKRQTPIAIYSADCTSIGILIGSVKQLKTQEVAMTLDMDKGMLKIFERTKGEFLAYFPCERKDSLVGEYPLEELNLNFKIMRILMSSGIAFGICTVKVFKSLISFELNNGMIIMVKRL